MNTCLLIVLLHSICAIKCASITIAAPVEGNQIQQIQDLEKEKIEIYNQLNDAVEDTINTLEKSNDSDAREGIAYMQELFALVNKFNGTELAHAQAHTVCNDSKECASNRTILFDDGRRQARLGHHKRKGYEHIKHAIMATAMRPQRNVDEIDSIRDEKVRNLLVLQTKLDKWLKLREAEKKKIKQYRLRQISHRHDTVTEECPNFGETRNAKSKGEESSRPRKYPCCRKCCKKSYMGCL